MPIELTIHPHTLHKCPLTKNELEQVLESMLAILGESPLAIELLLITDATMELLNANTFDLAGPTNILSFPYGQGDPTVSQIRQIAGGNESCTIPLICAQQANVHAASCDFLGSLVLSVDTLQRECFLYQQEPVEHAIRLLAHGMAHLAGYDHGQDMDVLCSALEQTGNAAYNGIS